MFTGGITAFGINSQSSQVASSFVSEGCSDMDHSTECQDMMLDRFGVDVDEYHEMMPLHQLIMADNVDCALNELCPQTLIAAAGSEVQCTNGKAKSNGVTYPCNDVNLLSMVPLTDLGSDSDGDGNDIWGWTQYDTNGIAIAHYALTGQTDGASIVDITVSLC